MAWLEKQRIIDSKKLHIIQDISKKLCKRSQVNDVDDLIESFLRCLLPLKE